MSATLERSLSHARKATRSTRPEPVTLVISRHVRPDKVAEYEAWLHRLTKLASHHDGYMGVTVLRPPHGKNDPEFVTIAHFDTEENLAAWMSDPERAAMVARSQDFGDAPEEVVTEPGVEFWFTPNDAPALVGGGPAAQPPPRWKMAVVLTLVIFVLSQALTFSLSPVVDLGVPRAVVQLVALAAQICLLTYWLLPKLNKVLAFWLTPKAG